MKFFETFFTERLSSIFDKRQLLKIHEILRQAIAKNTEALRNELKKKLFERHHMSFQEAAVEQLMIGFEQFYKGLLTSLGRTAVIDTDQNYNLFQVRPVPPGRHGGATSHGGAQQGGKPMPLYKQVSEDPYKFLLITPRNPYEIHKALINSDTSEIKNLTEQYINKPSFEKIEGEKLTKKQRFANENVLCSI
jgi:hypothetical protein